MAEENPYLRSPYTVMTVEQLLEIERRMALRHLGLLVDAAEAARNRAHLIEVIAKRARET